MRALLSRRMAPVVGPSLKPSPMLYRSFSSGATAVPVTVAPGDGVGPEIMDATLKVLQASDAAIDPQPIVIGAKVYEKGVAGGIDEDAWESINRTKLLLKAPIATPLGGGVKSLNVTLRKTLGLYANVRPVQAYHPFVPSLHEKMDMVIVRENEEDLYAGIEHRHTTEVLQCLKLISIPGSRRIIRYAFEYCMKNNRKKLTCVTKSNIMKITDGSFQKLFEEIAEEYPEVEAEHQIVDIATARVAARPQGYDVIVTPNLYGDIISDVAAEVAGSVGLAGSSNIGENYAMFEAVHGSANDIAGQNIANPGGLLNASVMMLNYLGQSEPATMIHNAFLRTIEDGVHTIDIKGDATKEVVGTTEFADAVVARLGQKPETLTPVHYSASEDNSDAVRKTKTSRAPPKIPKKSFVGVDIFVDWEPLDRTVEVLVKSLKSALRDSFELEMVSNRGVKVWPNGHPDTFTVNHWRCRYIGKPDTAPRDIAKLMTELDYHGVEVIKTENLYDYDGEQGFSKSQGQ